MKTLSLLFILICLGICSKSYGQDNPKTDGMGNYWNPDDFEFFQIFKTKYRAAKYVDHHLELNENKLLIRLESDEKKISILEKRGKKKTAEKLRAKAEKLNSEIIRSMDDNCKGIEYYFYFSHDATDIFQNKNYSHLHSDMTTPVNDVKAIEIDKFAYVLMHSSRPNRRGKVFNLHLWDKKSVSRIDNYSYHKYPTLMSSKLDVYESIKDFCDLIELAKKESDTRKN